LHGKSAFVPLINRRIPIITDEYVTMEFGTGALKVTPAHDMNDNQLGIKHGLEVVDIFNEDGTLNESAQIYVGLDRFEARKMIVVELEEKGYLVKTEDYTSEVGYSERTDVVVEPRLSLQWWVSMKDLATPALRSVIENEIAFYPPKFRNLYRHWMENIKDWCISRQLWWGHRIPAWYDEEGRYVVAENENEAKEIFNIQYSISNPELKQDEDCLDTWFSSWLWPFEVFKGYSNPGNAEIKYYYPTNTLVTAPEIIFFWVARMIMAGYEYMGGKPFQQVYFTGIVRDKQGRKMSKSLGNSPDLLGLIDQYGADAVRFGIMIASPAGNDILFDESALEQGRNFNNKLWNALKLVKMWEGRQSTVDSGQSAVGSEQSAVGSGQLAVGSGQSAVGSGQLAVGSQQQTNDERPTTNFATDWFAIRLKEVRLEVEEMMKQFRLSEALKTIYSLTWDDFCSWYLEWVKPGFEQPIDAAVYESTVDYFEQLMELLHPFMPFVTEEIYHRLRERYEDLCIKISSPVALPDNKILDEGSMLKQVISAIRDARNRNQLKPKESVRLYIQTSTPSAYTPVETLLSRQVNAASISYTDQAIADTIVVAVEKEKFYLDTGKALDSGALKTDLLKDLEHQKGFLAAVEKKLGNERFVQNAKPEVLELELKKKADAEARIRTIEESLSTLR